MPKKVIVGVVAFHDTSGNIEPRSIHWTDQKVYEIDRVLDSRRAASLKVGGIGTRYTVRIRGRETYLFHEEEKWFVEGRE